MLVKPKFKVTQCLSDRRLTEILFKKVSFFIYQCISQIKGRLGGLLVR